MNIIDRKEDRNKIDVTVSIEDDLLKCESYMTYKAVFMHLKYVEEE